MSREQYMWGLSNGVMVLGMSATFWLALSAWTVGFGAFLIALVPVLVVGGAIAAGAIRLRRRASGFSPSSFRKASKGSPTRRIIASFYTVTAVQWISIVLVGVICTELRRTDLLWPLIGLVVSLHFLPLATVFGVRPYYVAGTVGAAIVMASIWALSGESRLVTTGLGLGLTAVACATYVIAKADSIADRALRHTFGPARS